MNPPTAVDSAALSIPTVDNALAKSGDLSADGIASLRAAYAPIYDSLGPLVEQARAVKADQPKQARATRLALREVRCQGESTRKRLKADILLRGKAIDGMQHVLEYATEPLESTLLAIEEAEARAEAARKAKLQQERADQLRPYADPTHMDLGSMGVEAWEMILTGARTAHQTKLDNEAREKARREEEQRKAAEELARKQESERLERERMAAENERLRQEAAVRDAELAKEREAQRIKDAALEAERKKLAEAAARAEAEAARLNNERIAKAKAEAAAKRKAARAPDKAKVAHVADQIRAIQIPVMASEEGVEVANEIRSQIEKFAAWLERKAGEM
jgi:hypothetical protein